MFKSIALVITLLLGAQQPTDPSVLKRAITEKVEQLQLLVQELPLAPPAPTTIEVRAGDDLQAALAKAGPGGIVELQGGATFTGPRFTIIHPGTIVRGHGAKVVGTSGPAFYIPPAVNDVVIGDVEATSAWAGAVIQCGDNGPTQVDPAVMPTGAVFWNVTVPTHRGKRAFEINCAARLMDSHAYDVWSSALADSQGIAILNSCGPVTVIGGEYVAASENILIGGDVNKMPCLQAALTFRNLKLTKPDYWRTDGTKRAVKNLFEVKSGRTVVLADSVLSGSWGPAFGGAQDGSAIVITPKNGNYIEGVLIDNVTVERAASGVQLLGVDYNSVTPQPTTGVVIRNSRFTVSKTFGGRGILALYVGGMLDSIWENIDATLDGPAIVVADSKTPQGPFVMRNSRLPTGAYGIQAPGANYGDAPGPTYAGRELAVTLEGNTFTGAPARFRANFAGNVYQ